jgi:hypothetical protein
LVFLPGDFAAKADCQAVRSGLFQNFYQNNASFPKASLS